MDGLHLQEGNISKACKDNVANSRRHLRPGARLNNALLKSSKWCKISFVKHSDG